MYGTLNWEIWQISSDRPAFACELNAFATCDFSFFVLSNASHSRYSHSETRLETNLMTILDYDGSSKNNRFEILQFLANMFRRATETAIHPFDLVKTSSQNQEKEYSHSVCAICHLRSTDFLNCPKRNVLGNCRLTLKRQQKKSAEKQSDEWKCNGNDWSYSFTHWLRIKIY